MAKRYLPAGHQSGNAEKASFLFALAGARGLARLILVEAESPAAVAALELVLTEGSGSVGQGCRQVGVFRDADAGVRDDILEEVPYVEFFTDFVDPKLVLGSDEARTAFSDSLTARDRAWISARARAPEPAVDPEDTVKIRTSRPPAKGDAHVAGSGPTQSQRLEFALAGMGFQKGPVQRFIKELGPRAEGDRFESLVREGLSALS